jgi:hypothetical protein
MLPFVRAGLALAGEWLGPFAGFDQDEEPFWVRAVTENRTYRYIVQSVDHRMNRRSQVSNAAESGMAARLREARLLPTMRSRIGLLARVLFRPRMWQTFPLPDSVFFLYPVLSPFEWTWFRVRKLIHRGVVQGVVE